MGSSVPTPLAISDNALQTLLELAHPLAVADRSAFLEGVAVELRGHADLGDGLVCRTARKIQKQFLKVPDLADMRGSQSRIAGMPRHKPTNGG
jgi:hypothetical protein